MESILTYVPGPERNPSMLFLRAFLLGIIVSLVQTHPGVSQGLSSTSSSRTDRDTRVAPGAVHFALRDSAETTNKAVQVSAASLELAVTNNIDESADNVARLGCPDVKCYPSHVSHDPGFPGKPLWQRPGDVDLSDYPPPRYCQDDNFRSGWPNCLRRWTMPSITSHYSAWYVGGGSAGIFPRGRCRAEDEGTWGLDYSLWKRPRTVWMLWTNGRYQAGEGLYTAE